MDEPERELTVAADDYRITADDVVLSALLQGSLAVCLYDATGQHGALLHLRLAGAGQSRDPELSDNTLSCDLALLDRTLREIAAVSPRSNHWQAKLVAQRDDQDNARLRCAGLQAFIGAFLKDAGVSLVSSVAHAESALSVRFRPAMGQVRTQSASVSA